MCVVQVLSRSWLSSRVKRVPLILILILILILYEGKEKRKAQLLKRSRLKKKKLLEVIQVAVRNLLRKISLLVFIQCSTVRVSQSAIFNNQQKTVGSLCTADYS